MKIDKIEIDGFGKLHNLSITLHSGFNLIFGENESGKSTLCAFLLSMFYEMPNDGKRTELSASLRRKYKPWNAERFGGRVHFTHEGKQYILEKTFGTTKRSDRARLMDANTWEECGSADNVGERFFGLGRDGFLKTLYIQGMGAEAANMGGEELLARLSNLETSGDEDISYMNIKNALEKEQFSILTKTGKGGKLAARREEERALQTELLAAQRAYDNVKEKTRQAELLKTRIAQQKEAIQSAEQTQQIALAHESYLAEKNAEDTRTMLQARRDRETERQKALEEKKAQLLQKRKEAVPPDAVDRAKILEKQQAQLETTKDEQKRQTQALLENVKLARDKANKTGIFGAVFLLFLFTVAGVLLQRVSRGALYGFFAAGVFCSVLLFIFWKKRSKQDEEDLAPAMEQLENTDQRLNQTKADIKTLCQTYKADGLTAFFARVAEENGDKTALDETQRQLLECSAEVQSLTEDIDRLPAGGTKQFTEEEMEYSGVSAADLTKQIQACKDDLEACTQRHHTLSLELAKQTADGRSIADIASDLMAVNDQIDTLQKQHDALQQASCWLERAYGEIRQNYAPRLNEKTAQTFARLTFDKYSGVRLGEALKLHYQNENNEIVDASFLSGGAYDLLYLSLRFAAMQILFEENIPPVILDDALLQLDDDRLTATVDFLAESDAFGQVLYFTCHKASIELFDRAAIHKLKL